MTASRGGSEFELGDAIGRGSQNEQGRVPLVVRAGVVLLLLVLLASAAARVGRLDPNRQDLANTLQPPSFSAPFGTDDLGRDVFLRTIYASLTDLQIAAIATVVPLAVGLCIGLAAGYVRGPVEAITMRLTDMALAFPFMVLALSSVAILGNGVAVLYAALMIKGLPNYVRLSRGEMLVLREREFVLAAQTLGFPKRRILFRHVCPHVARPCLIYSLSDLILNIIGIATLSFLGVGVKPPTPEWGAIIAAGQTDLLGAWWVSTLPGLFLVVVGLSISLTGEALTERLRLALG